MEHSATRPTHFYYQGLWQLFSTSHLMIFVYEYVEHAHPRQSQSKVHQLRLNGSILENDQSRIGT